jgi:probable F420-dependent oxidoreductase
MAALTAPQETIAQAATWASELGFDSVWASDHVLMPPRVESFYPYAADRKWAYAAESDWFDPLIALAWAGAAASDIKLGTSVVVLPLRNPMLLAKQVATLDLLTGGRVLLGVGVGWMREEFAAIGVPFDDRWPRANEMVELMRLLWSGEPVTYQGRVFGVDGVVARPRPSRTPPIYWGGRSANALRSVVELGDGWYPFGLTETEFAEALAQLMRICGEKGRDPESLTICVSLGRSQRLTAELVAWYAQRGVRRLVCSPPRDNMGAFRAELERVSATVGLRGSRGL